MKKGIYKNMVFILALILVDMLTKVVINNFFMESKVLLTENFGFVPFINKEQMSIFNNELGLQLDLWVLVVINIVAIIAFVLYIKKLNRKEAYSQFFEMAIEFVLAGSICSLLDKIIWGGSLDYVLLFSQIIDLKDVYLFIGVCFYCVALFKQVKKEINQRGKK